MSLQCTYNQINSLDLSSHPDLMVLYCYSNALTELNIKNGNNANITLFAAHYNYNLTCIQVDDADVIPSNWTKDSQAVYSENCYVIWTFDNEWSNVVGPTINDNVIIEGNLVLDDDLAAKNLTIAENGSLTIPADKTLTLSRRVSNQYNSDQFIIQNNGNLIQTGIATNSGNITVHRESDPMIRLDYTLWSSPVVGQNLFGFSPETVNGVTNYEGSPGRIYVYDGTNGYVNPNPFLETTEMNSGAGYLFRAPNNYSSTVPANYDGVFTGQPYNGNLSVTTAANNYTSVGNPYPSNIDADLFLAVNPDITSLYLWLNNHSPGNNYASCTSGNCVAAAGGGNQPNGVIAVGQGFIVATTNTSVNFTNSMRTADATDFFRPSTTEKHRFWINLLDDENVGFNQILVGYMEGATMGIDQQIDGKMFGYEGSALYNIIDNDAFVIQGRSLPFADSDVVPLGFRATENGKFKIELDNFDGLFAEGQAIYVKDNLLGIQHKLTNSAYEFESEAGTFKDRFEIVYVEEGIMGIDDLTANGILIYKNQNLIEISSKESPIDSVEIFDLLGRKLFSESGINSPVFQVDSKQFETQVLIVKVKTENGKMKTKKWMNK
ncbi:MAG: T9SS sorting signal type C domain-containing protein [Moheibacter sp.]